MQQFHAEVRRHSRTFLIALAVSVVQLAVRSYVARVDSDPDRHDFLAHL